MFWQNDSAGICAATIGKGSSAMKLIFFLVKASWRTVLLAAMIGSASGVASILLLDSILRALGNPAGSSSAAVGSFAALCLVILATRIASNLLLCRLTQQTISRMRMGICRRILASPLVRLEEIGMPRMLGTLTGDVSAVSQAMNGVPTLAVNVVILVGGAVYLGALSPRLLAILLGFCALGVASYWYAAKFANRYVRRSREAYDVWLRHVRALFDGVKELKMHGARRGEFVQGALDPAEALRCRSKILCDTTFDAAVIWGRLLFFVAIGLLLFGWAKQTELGGDTLARFVFTIMFLMSPLEQIMAWLPFLSHASVSVANIERLGLTLDALEEERPTPAGVDRWEQIELAGVTHAYSREGQSRGFVLGPVDLALRPGDIVFIVGGNGSGKTTLAKILAGLYVPESGEVRLDGEPVTAENREAYRQLFSVVFDDAAIFESLWGMEARDLDQRAQEYLRRLDLDRVVSVSDGRFSTTKLSRGQRKRLALLTAYLEDRPIYVFDEWAADQDPVFRRLFYLHLLPELKSRGKTVVAVTHDDHYFGVADCVVKLDEGKLAEPPVADAVDSPQLGKV
jgi:putative pyoverdin transport system ATP-binding/permease protein